MKVTCPHRKKEKTLKEWWKKHRLPKLLEYQVKLVANTTGLNIDHKKHPKYKQSERLIKKCGFYDDIGVKEV